MDMIDDIILENKQVKHSRLIFQELLKTFMSRISSLKFLKHSREFQIVPFVDFPRAKDCLTDLSAFCCHSDINPNFFNQLSQICHNIQTLTVVFGNNI